MRRNRSVFRSGYVKVFFVSLFLAFIQTLNHDYFAGRVLFDLKFFLQTGIVFLVLFIPGFFLVRWYYKVMDNNKPGVLNIIIVLE